MRFIEGGISALEIFLAAEPQPPPAPPIRDGSSPLSTPIKRSSSAQAPTRDKMRATTLHLHLPEEKIGVCVPPSSPARPPRRAQMTSSASSRRKGTPTDILLPHPGPNASLVSPSFRRNTMGRNMLKVHTPTGAVVSPTLIST